jgi:hypothetical protein
MVLVTKTYTFEPVGVDLWEKRPHQPAPGTVVIKTQPHGCPRNGTMGHCFIAHPDGHFIGLVLVASLQEVVKS